LPIIVLEKESRLEEIASFQKEASEGEIRGEGDLGKGYLKTGITKTYLFGIQFQKYYEILGIQS
jgi:hypothetical protein